MKRLVMLAVSQSLTAAFAVGTANGFKVHRRFGLAATIR